MATRVLVATWIAMCGAMVYTDPRLWVVVASSAGFGLVRVAAVPLVAARVKAFATFDRQKQALWSNTAVSLLHSTASSLLACAALALGHSLGGDYVNGASRLEFLTTAVSTGYFAYDLWDYVLHRLYVKAPGIVWHHAVILICYISALVKTVGVPLLSLALLCELHSAFMHLRKLLSMSGVTSTTQSPALSLIWAAQWVAFAAARTVPHIKVLSLTYTGRELFTHKLHFGMAFSGILFINLLNAQLFRDVLRAYRKDTGTAKFKTI